MSQPRRAVGTFLLLGALLALPYAWAYRSVGAQALFGGLAADAMYYLAAAQSWREHGFPTFDGVYPSSGFHPLWAATLYLVFALGRVSLPHQVFVLAFLSLLLVAAAMTLMVSTFAAQLPRRAQRLALALLLFPGAYSLLVEPAIAQLAVDPGVLYRVFPWSAVNGMETAPLLLAQAVFVHLAFARGGSALLDGRAGLRGLLAPSIALAFLVLARLDEVWFALAVALLLALQPGWPPRERLRRIAWLAVAPALALGLFALVLRIWLDVWIPASGAEKVGLHLGSNLAQIASLADGTNRSWGILAVRVFPLLYSILVGALLVVIAAPWRKPAAEGEAGSLRPLCFVIGAYALLKGSFLLVAVELIQQGFWYYHGAVLWTNAVLALWVARSARSRAQRAGVLTLAALCVLSNVAQVDFLLVRRMGRDSYSTVSLRLWRYGEQIRADLLRHDPQARIIDNLDGAYAYFLRLPAESATGFMSSRNALARRREVGLFQLAYERGYDILPVFGIFGTRDNPRWRCDEFYRHELANLGFCRLRPR
jgi:hypothetical protein